MYKRLINILVGLFMMAGIAGLLVLAYKVSSFSSYQSDDSYILTAEFDNIGSLKIRAPVAIAGVKIGQVDSIVLDPNSFKAKVTMSIDDKNGNIPTDTSASILTQGLLGSNYISLMPGFATDSLKEGDSIDTTHSALVLENLIGQLMFKLNNDSSASNDASDSASSAEPASAAANSTNGSATSVANEAAVNAAPASNDATKSAVTDQVAGTAKSAN